MSKIHVENCTVYSGESEKGYKQEESEPNSSQSLPKLGIVQLFEHLVSYISQQKPYMQEMLNEIYDFTFVNKYFQCFWADKVGDESDEDDDRDIVGIDDDEVEAEDDEEGDGGILSSRQTSPSSFCLGPRWASRAGRRTRPWNKPNTTVRTNTLNNEECIWRLPWLVCLPE